jgi:hypothetical protein
VLDAGADYNRNRNAMIEQGLIKAEQSKIIWQSAPLPNDAVAVSKALYADKALVARLQAALPTSASALKTKPPCCRRITPALSAATTPSTSRSATPAWPPASCRPSNDGARPAELAWRATAAVASAFLALALAMRCWSPPVSFRCWPRTSCRWGAIRWPTW